MYAREKLHEGTIIHKWGAATARLIFKIPIFDEIKIKNHFMTLKFISVKI